jgi:hypothetical protein
MQEKPGTKGKIIPEWLFTDIYAPQVPKFIVQSDYFIPGGFM